MDTGERYKEWINLREKILKEDMVYRSAYQGWLQYYNFKIRFKRMNRVFNFGKGKGTYVVALVTIVWAAWGWYQGTIDPVMAQQTVFAALGVMGFRRAMK